MASQRLITITTDFGTSDPFVGAMKGAIYNINPEAKVVDISHDIPSGDIQRASFIIGTSYLYFPQGTIHLVVVDPTVGSERKKIIVSTEKYIFIAPDNGVLSMIYSKEEIYAVREITEDYFFLKPTHPTFHGRDVFAPVAAWLSKGIDSSKFGRQIEEKQIIKLEVPSPTEVKPKAFKGIILYIDKFGNLITNFTRKEIPLTSAGYPTVMKVITIRGEITDIRKYFSEKDSEGPFFIYGGSGYYEISAKGKSAALMLNLKEGNEIGVILK